MGTLPDHVRGNHALWNRLAAEYQQPGRRLWAQAEPTWGNWNVPESQLHVLPTDLAGLDTIELGCGTDYVSAWLARRGARPVGLDISPAQLAGACRFQQEFGVAFPLLLADAEQVPLADASFDLAISEYGVSHWCDPDRGSPRPPGRCDQAAG